MKDLNDKEYLDKMRKTNNEGLHLNRKNSGSITTTPQKLGKWEKQPMLDYLRLKLSQECRELDTIINTKYKSTIAINRMAELQESISKLETKIKELELEGLEVNPLDPRPVEITNYSEIKTENATSDKLIEQSKNYLNALKNEKNINKNYPNKIDDRDIDIEPQM